MSLDTAKHFIGSQSNITIESEDNGVTFFAPTIEEQLELFEKVKRQASEYKSSLNIQSQAPKFWEQLGLNPLKLGLDLRGGVHFVLDVDIVSALELYRNEVFASVQKQMRQLEITYHVTNEVDGLKISIQDPSELVKVQANLVRHFSDLLITKVDSQHLLIKLQDAFVAQRQEQVVETTLLTMSQRVNELGLSEATLYRQGKNQIVIDLPGIQDVHEAKSLLGKTATVEFYLAYNKDWRHGQPLPLGSLIKTDENNVKFPLKHKPILTGASIVDAQIGNSQDGRPAVDLRISSDILRKFKMVTREHQGWAMAVVYKEVTYKETWNEDKKDFDITPVLDERVISYATIIQELGERFQITGLTQEQSAELSLLLRSGSLPTSVKIVEEKTIGPSLGQDNIDQGITALLYGSFAIFIFMFYFYGLLGIIANITLVCNLCFLLALLSLLQATLTLPGIAGIVLTIGMAVDANVLIFERIKEEVSNGRNSWTSINMGFDRAMITIFDSNLTTFSVGLILLTLGSGIIRGFAVTLTLGIITSIYSALIGTKVFIKMFYRNTDNPQLRMKRFF